MLHAALHILYLECLQYNFLLHCCGQSFFFGRSFTVCSLFFALAFNSQKVIRMQKKIYCGQMSVCVFFLFIIDINDDCNVVTVTRNRHGSCCFAVVFRGTGQFNCLYFTFFSLFLSSNAHCLLFIAAIGSFQFSQCCVLMLHTYDFFVCYFYFAINMYLGNFQADAQLYYLINK